MTSKKNLGTYHKISASKSKKKKSSSSKTQTTRKKSSLFSKKDFDEVIELLENFARDQKTMFTNTLWDDDINGIGEINVIYYLPQSPYEQLIFNIKYDGHFTYKYINTLTNEQHVFVLSEVQLKTPFDAQRHIMFAISDYNALGYPIGFSVRNNDN